MAEPTRRQMRKRILLNIIWLFCLSFMITGCKEKTEVVDMLRSIKTITVNEQSTGQLLKFSGLVAAVDFSGLSFEVNGHVLSMQVDIGDRVEKGQVLAELDPEPYLLEVDEAQAALKKTKDNVTKTKAQYDRQKRIYEQGAGAKSNLEVAEYDYNSALSQVSYQEAKLKSAERNLQKTKLLSPYDGTIASRSVEPNEEVAAGKEILEINATGKMEVQLDVPETSINMINTETPVTVTFPTLPGESVQGLITDIGTAAFKANSFPVKVELINPNKEIKPGMTAEANLKTESSSGVTGYKIPLQAILPNKNSNEGVVFIFDTQTSTVKETLVHAKGIDNKMAVVNKGLKPGDIIAVAGISFLADGMEVKLMK